MFNSDRINRVADLLTIIACVAVLLIVGYKFFIPLFLASQREFPLPGTQVPISKIEANLQNRNAFIAISPDCSYCIQSTEFYKKLLSSDFPADRKFFVLFDHSDLEKANDFLNKYELNGLRNEAQHFSVNFKEFGVTATPTIIITDQKGVVIRTWVGKLTGSQEVELFSLLKNST